MSRYDKDASQRTFSRRDLLLAGSAILTPWAVARSSADLDFAPAFEAARAIRGRAVSSLELTRRMVERIGRSRTGINAIATLLGDSALARAKAADEALARGEIWGPLHGVPCTVKDTFEMAGVRTTAGDVSLTDYVPVRDAPVVARMRAAGAVMLGKDNTPRLAMDWQTHNEIFGVTNNPYNLERTPGGSSGGAAAALAAGLTYLSVGSDIGGSIRIPAHFCGVYGLKPTLNVIPPGGHIPPRPGGPPYPESDLNVAGPLARSAADLRLALEVLGGPEGDDAKAYRWSLSPARGARLGDYRIGYVLDDHLCPVSSDVAVVLAGAIGALRKAGAHITEGWPGGLDVQEQYDTYRYLLSSVVARLVGDVPGDEALRKRAANQDHSHEAIEALALTAPHERHVEASRGRMKARAIWREYFRTHDAFLLPTSFVAAFPHDRRPGPRTLATSQGPRDYLDMLFWITFATLAGIPAVIAPVGFTRDGLPVGIQILGPYLEDATPIDLAGRMAEVIGGFSPPKGS